MKQPRIWIPVALSTLFLFVAVPALWAQLQPGAPAAPTSLEDRRKALNDLFHEYWEAYLARNPEFASSIGDTRFNDKVSDNSVKAYNAWLEHEQNWMLRLAAIAPDGLNDQEKFKPWEMPVTQMDGIQTEYPQLVALLSFKSVKDYDDWIARLHAIPDAFAQVTTNMSIGVDDRRVPPKFILEKIDEQVKQLAAQKP